MVKIQSNKNKHKLTKVEIKKIHSDCILRSRKLVKGIEEAHKRAGNSKLLFK